MTVIRGFLTSFWSLPMGRTPCGNSGTLADMEISEMALMEGGHTVYSTVGDLFGYLAAAWCAFLWLARPWWRRRQAGEAATASTPSSGGGGKKKRKKR